MSGLIIPKQSLIGISSQRMSISIQTPNRPQQTEGRQTFTTRIVQMNIACSGELCKQVCQNHFQVLNELYLVDGVMNDTFTFLVSDFTNG